MMDVPTRIVELCRWLHEGGEGPDLDTEWLGDLYQAHCEAARKGRALVQTPGFIRSFILDRTLGRVLADHGPAQARTIDPACGCGHFLVDAFRMTYGAWMSLPVPTLDRHLLATGGVPPGAVIEAAVAQMALDQVVGVDLDPACVAIARTRLLFEAWRVSDVRMPYRLKVFEGDALLQGRPRPDDDARFGPFPPDVVAARAVLRPGQYTAVVANPPYITGKDATLREAYRERYPTCHGQFSLAVPFAELCFDLAVRGGEDESRPVVREHQGVLFLDPGPESDREDAA